MRRLRTSRFFGLAIAVGLLSVSLSPAAAENPPKLRYTCQKDQAFAYHIKIQVIYPSEEIIREGTVLYTVVSASEDQFVWKSSGGLQMGFKLYQTRSVDTWPGVSPQRFPVGPALVLLRNEGVTLSRTGDVLAAKRNNLPIKMPFLLGDLDLLPIEPLPKEPQASWHKASEVLVVQNNLTRLYSTGEPELVTVDAANNKATEKHEYTILEQKGDKVRIGRKYSLQSPEISGARCADLSGSGEVEFDLKRGVVGSIAMKYKLVFNDSHVSTTIPVTFSCRLLSEAETAEYKKKQNEAEEAKRPKPLAPGEKEKLIKDLQSHDPERIKTAAQRLSKAILDDDPAAVAPALAAALSEQVESKIRVELVNAAKLWSGPELEKPLIAAARSDDFMVRDPAIEALGKFKSRAAAEAVASRLADSRRTAFNALRAMGPVAEPVLIPYVTNHDFWIRNEVCRVLGEIGGKKSLQALKREMEHLQDHERHGFRNAISAIEGRLSYDEAKESADDEPPARSEAKSALRTWHDATQTFEVEATFLSCQDDKVMLQRKDGKKIRIPLEKLSDEDQAFVKKQPKPTNPFE